jgi:hypothetical protein
MARPPANKPASNNVPTDGYILPARIDDPMQEIMFLLGRLNHATADRVTELILGVQRAYQTQITELQEKVSG